MAQRSSEHAQSDLAAHDRGLRVTADSPREARHKARMQRKKALMDDKIAQSQQKRGLLLINTGNGKGKSSAAFGLLARALGHDMQVAVVQFIKGAASTGEERFFRRFPEQVRYYVMGEGFTWETQDRQRDVEQAQRAWAIARTLLQDQSLQLIVLDELNIALKHGYLALEPILADLQARSAHQHVVITGRGAPVALIEAADTVTEMALVKHAFKDGVKAQPGIEY